MKKRLTMAIAAGALVAAMVPGVASAGGREAYVDGGCYPEGGLNFGKIEYIYLNTSAGMSLGQVVGGYHRFQHTCRTPGSYGILYVNGVPVDDFVNS